MAQGKERGAQPNERGNARADKHSNPEMPERPAQGLNGAQDSGGNPSPADAPPRAAEEPGTREERVRQAAYRRYTERGGAGGNDVDDWLAAEAEIGQAPGSTDPGRDPA